MYSRTPARPPRVTGEPSYRRVMALPPNYSGNAFPTRISGDMPPADDGMIPDENSIPDESRDVSPLSMSPDCPAQDGEPCPRFGDLPRVSSLPNRTAYTSLTASGPLAAGAGRIPDLTDSLSEEECGTDAGEDAASVSRSEPDRAEKESLPASLPTAKTQVKQVAVSPLFPLFTPSHFPLGHGLGQEEIWLLGLVLFLLHENSLAGSHEEGSDLGETILLLAILLLCG